MDIDSYLVIAVLGQLLFGVAAAVGVIIGLRLALPSLARALVRELAAARLVDGEEATANDDGERGRPVVTLERRDELST